MSNISKNFRLFVSYFISIIVSFFVLSSNFSIVGASLIDDVINSGTVFNRACEGKSEGLFEYVKFLPGGKGIFYGVNNSTSSSQLIGKEIVVLEDGERITIPIYKDPDTYVLKFSWTKNEANSNQVFMTFENNVGYAVALNNTNGNMSFRIVDVIHKIKNPSKDLKIVFPPVFKGIRASESSQFFSDGSLHQTINLKKWEDKKTEKNLLVPDYRYAAA